MKTLTCFLFICMLMSTGSYAQKIVRKNRADLYFNFGTNQPAGSPVISNGAFNSPALFSNMKKSFSYEVQYMHALWKKIYLGGSLEQTNFSEWSYSDLSTYSGTSASIFSVSPVVMLKTNVLKDKISFFVSALPGLNQISVKTSNQSTINSDPMQAPFESKTLCFGIGLRGGLNIVWNSFSGISLSAGYQTLFVNSMLYSEKRVNYLDIKAGLFLRLQKDKKYKYSDL